MSDRIDRSIDVAAPIERVWRALTDHREFGEWFRVALDQPFALGEVSTGHMTYPGYEHVAWRAVVTAMEPPTRFAFTWPHPEDYNAPAQADAPHTTVEFRLEPTAAGTRVHVSEYGFDAIPAARRADAMRSNEGGWTEQMSNIKAYVER